jgi:hypothetical protein
MKILVFLLLLSSVHKAQLTDFEVFPEKKEFSIDDYHKQGLILLRAFTCDSNAIGFSQTDMISGLIFTHLDIMVNFY